MPQIQLKTPYAKVKSSQEDVNWSYYNWRELILQIDGTIINRVALLTTWVMSSIQKVVTLRQAAGEAQR